MELRHLRYFVAAAEEEHFGRASERLHVTRPAVSQLIIDLENEIGTQLFERLAHSVKLTAAGRVLLPKLQTIMIDLGQAFAMAKLVGQGKSGALNVGYGSLTLLHPLFRAAIKEFHESYPNVTLSLFEIPTSEQVKALAVGKIDVGFMHFGPASVAPRKKGGSIGPARDGTALDYLTIQTGSLGAVVPQDHPLARKKSVSLGELAGEQFVVVPHSSVSPGYGPLYALCKPAGFEPQIVQEVSSIASQLNLVSVGMGIGLAVVGQDFTYPSGVAVIPLKDVKYKTSFLLGWIKGRSEPVLDRLIEIVKAAAK
ncbi:LysR family transcriptional regulator [Caballeronia udeis]|uniref:LysR family transcriptional regulator n=1 Tax=Caballeronia udeis TaxID=1232866 RepID=A0A158IDZ4_9BURK|nr:LysR substrate-binding domain-containing protein [Caballeronia udeis]SAL54766.1 LysR family transcriptional regulator [Caballeronia udeis]